MALTLSGTAPSLQSYQGGALTNGTAQASTSGTAIGFTGIPSWVKRITIMWSGVNQNSASSYLIQIGSGSFTTTGYASTTTVLTASPSPQANTTGFGFFCNLSTLVLSGSMTLTLLSGNTWAFQGIVGGSTTSTNTITSCGVVTLSGVLDRVQVTSVSAGTFTAGSINILYE